MATRDPFAAEGANQGLVRDLQFLREPRAYKNVRTFIYRHNFVGDLFSLNSNTSSAERMIMKIAVRAERDIGSLATFVHAVLAGVPALGIVYNLTRENFPQSREP